jgi:hypothetical protein
MIDGRAALSSRVAQAMPVIPNRVDGEGPRSCFANYANNQEMLELKARSLTFVRDDPRMTRIGRSPDQIREQLSLIQRK